MGRDMTGCDGEFEGGNGSEDWPKWFRDALSVRPASHCVTVEGCPIHYLRWGSAESSKPGLVFLHAGGAHAQWWSFIAPFFAESRTVIAMDFSGMGDSGHRTTYSSALHIAEIEAVARDADLGEKPVIVGHSFGGYMAMCYGHRHGDRLSAAVFVDSPLRPAVQEKASPREAYTRPKRIYPDLKTILSRFRLMPEQTCENTFILDYVGRHSVTECDGGWAWKFDVAARGADHHREPLADYLRDLSCPKGFIYGAESAMAPPDSIEYTRHLLGPFGPVVCVPEAHHHITADQPLAFVTALRCMLSSWRL